MIRKEIKHFKLRVGSYTDIDASVPASVISCLHKAKIIPEPCYGAIENTAILSRGASFFADFDVDAMMLGVENLYLSVGGVDSPLVVLINGAPIKAILPESVRNMINIKTAIHLGKNRLEMRFAPRADVAGEITDISIYDPVEIVYYNKAVIENVVVRQAVGKESVRLDIEMSTSGYMRSSRAVAVLVSPGGAVSYSTIINGKGWMEIKNPNLWKIGGYGSHHLYKLTVNLYADSELADTREFTLGLRTVSYNEAKGELSMSGDRVIPMMALGGRFDALKSRETKEKCATILRRATECGINMIYYDGKDRYPSEDYLSICDSLGIGVAVKLIVRAGARSEAELELVRRDLVRCFSYLGSHASVIAVVGCAEYRPLVESVMAAILPGAVYMEKVDAVVSAPPSLMSEYSASVYLPEDERNLLSHSIDTRAADRRDALLGSVARSYRMPTGFGEWTYLSGIISGTEAAESYLASLRAGQRICPPVGSISEPLPSVSASVTDYSARVKPMYYYLSRYARMAKASATVENGKISFYITNLQTNIYASKLVWAIIDNKNKEIFSDAIEFRVEPGVTKEVYDYDASDIIRGHESEYYLRFFATDSVGVHSETTMLFTTPREFKFLEPGVEADIVGANCDFVITLTARAYVRALEISFDPELDYLLSDNCVDVTSAVPVRLKLRTERPTAIELLKRTLSMRSMYNVGR